MLRKMEGGGCKPDRVVYSVIIDRLCMDGLLIEGLSLLSEMIGKGISMDFVSYNSLIHGLLNSHQSVEVSGFFEVERGEVVPELQTICVYTGY